MNLKELYAYHEKYPLPKSKIKHIFYISVAMYEWILVKSRMWENHKYGSVRGNNYSLTLLNKNIYKWKEGNNYDEWIAIDNWHVDNRLFI